MKMLQVITLILRLCIAELSFLLPLDSNVFCLSLPAQRSLLDQFGYLVHDDDHDHQHDDADKNIGGLENSCRHADEKTNPFGGGDEFTDDGADNRERDACSNSGKHVGRNRWENDFKTQLPSPDSHKARQVD